MTRAELRGAAFVVAALAATLPGCIVDSTCGDPPAPLGDTGSFQEREEAASLSTTGFPHERPDATRKQLEIDRTRGIVTIRYGTEDGEVVETWRIAATTP